MRLQALLCLAALAGFMGGDRPAPDVDEHAWLPLGPAVEQRVERFVLEARTTDEQGRARTEVAGFVEWRRRDDADGPQLECDVRFLRGSSAIGDASNVARVLQVECLTARGPRCQWREVGGTGRSVLAEWSPDGGALDVVEWSASGKKRGTLIASGGVSMPLYLVELARAGRINAGPVTRFDPLARTLEPLMVRTVWLESTSEQEDCDEQHAVPAPDERTPAPARDKRTIELLRADGTLAARYVFAGLELVAFQWQEGRLAARAVDETEFERLALLHLPPPPSTGRREQ
jgi:hypothetical protein